jgi:hypothetical protein
MSRCGARTLSWLLRLSVTACAWLVPLACLAQSPSPGESSPSPSPSGSGAPSVLLLPPTAVGDETPWPPGPAAPPLPNPCLPCPCQPNPCQPCPCQPCPCLPDPCAPPAGEGIPGGASPSPLGSLASPSGISLGLGGAGGAGIGGPGLFLNPVVGQLPVVGSYRAANYFNTPVNNQNAHLGYFGQNLSVLTPLWQCPTDEVSALANVGVESFNTNAILPDSHDHFPYELWRIDVGGTYRHLFDNGWIGGGGATVGSYSDRPFENLNVMAFTATGFLRVPSGQTNAWIYSVFISSNSQILPFIPIPSIAYFYAPGPELQALIGFPFADVNWSPAPDWSLFVSYALLTNFRARLNYRLDRMLRLFAAIDLLNENYYLADRPDPNDRFMSYYDRVYGGLVVLLGRQAFFDLSAGYAFDRRFFESTGGLKVASDLVTVGPGAFVAGTFQFRY